MLTISLSLAVLANLASAAMFSGYERYLSIGHSAVVRTRLDPIISPGTISGHVHSVIGSSAFTEGMTFDSATAGKCSTSFIQADKSGYWAPQFYYKYKNGTYRAISGDGLVAYWKFAYNTPDETFAVVPDDFRMLAGDFNRDTYDPTQASHNAISFQCMGDGYDNEANWIPADKECKTIRPQAFFPNCWNGKDAFLPGNKHVSYPTGNRFEGGPCSDGFVRIPSLFLEAYYKAADNVPDFEWYPGCFVFANGDNNGYSYHSDWLNGWPKGMLVDAYNKCGAETRNKDAAYHCVTEGNIANEIIGVESPIAYLPGNNVEFNSSKASPDHDKVSRPGYTESTEIIPVPADLSGACTPGGPRKCTEIKGGVLPVDVDDDTATSTSTIGSAGSSASATASSTSSASFGGQVLVGADGGATATVTVTVTATPSCPVVEPRAGKRLWRRGRMVGH